MEVPFLLRKRKDARMRTPDSSQSLKAVFLGIFFLTHIYVTHEHLFVDKRFLAVTHFLFQTTNEDSINN